MSGRCFVAGPKTRSLSSARIFFFNLKTQGRASSHSCRLMGVFSWERDCRRQGLGYLGQTGGVSTGLSGNKPRGNRWHRAFSLRLEVEAVWTEAITGPSWHGGSPRPVCPISGYRGGTTPPWPPNPVPVPKNRKHLLLSADRKPCPLDHSHLRGALPGGTQDPGLPKALPWSWPSNTGPFVSSGCSPPC